jgi:hypothetical protein
MAKKDQKRQRIRQKYAAKAREREKRIRAKMIDRQRK